jgi:type III secretory pathway component EscS
VATGVVAGGVETGVVEVPLLQAVTRVEDINRITKGINTFFIVASFILNYTWKYNNLLGISILVTSIYAAYSTVNAS